MTRRYIIALLLLFTTVAATRELSYQDLKAKADDAKGNDQDKLCAHVARRAVDVADDYYNAGDTEKAKATVEEAIRYAEKARDAARRSGKHLKQTEITLREAVRRLDQVGKSLAFEDRPYAEAALRRLEAAHQDVFNQMFGMDQPRPESKEKR